jgi:hypothetical protein
MPQVSSISSVKTTYGGVLISGSSAAITSSTTPVAVIAAVAGNSLYITSASFSNTDPSTTTLMQLQDGSGGTVLWQGIVPFGSGSNMTFPIPLKTTAGNGLYAKTVTSVASGYASCAGFKSTISH